MQHFYLILLVVCGVVQGKEYCTADTDCSDLGAEGGGLICVKSQCSLGVCGCPRGEVALFQTSTNKYACVKVRRVGQECDPSGEEDVCGPQYSFCNADGKCECAKDREPMRNGMTCEDPGSKTRYPGETCPSGTTCLDTTTCKSIPNPGDKNWYNPLSYNVPTCACPNNMKLEFALSRRVSEYLDNIYPTCVWRVVGDSCDYDTDCAGGAECKSNKCTCPENLPIRSYDGIKCYVTGLAAGEDCTIDYFSTPCDGSKDLVCDTCVVGETPKCVCGPFHEESGSECKPRVEGSDCYGDYNCKGFSRLGVCVNGKCEIGTDANGGSIAGGMQLASSMAGLLTMISVAALHNII